MRSINEDKSPDPLPVREEKTEEQPRELFRRIQKRDGTIVDFDREKITEAIWAAARSVGGTSRERADLLADRVILYLARIYDDHLLNIEEVQDAVEKVLIENGHAKTAKAYILYREKRTREREAEKMLGKNTAVSETPSVSVQLSKDERVKWNRSRIVEALLHETSIPQKFAENISLEIEKQIINGKMNFVTTSLIREMVNCKLIEHNLSTERKSGTRLEVGFPLVESILDGSNGATMLGHVSPRTADSEIAGEINRQYAFINVFPEEVVEAHLAGDIYLHHTDSVQSIHHSVHSVDYFKFFGCDFSGIPFREGPPRNARELLEGLAVFSRELAKYCRGGISWPCFNVFTAPFFAGLSDEDVALEIRSFFRSIASFGEGSQAVPVYIDLCWEVPDVLSMQPAAGPTGREEEHTYGRYLKTIRRLFRLIMQEYIRGDGRCQPVLGVEVRVHLWGKVWEGDDPKGPWEEIQAAIRERVGLTILFQRGPSLHFPECFQVSITDDDAVSRDLRYPWKIRYGTWGKVSMNLPRIMARTTGREGEVEEVLASAFRCVSLATDSKRKQMETLLYHGSTGPLGLFMLRKDGEPYLRRVSFLIGLYGVRDAALFLLDDPEAPDKALRETERRIIERLYLLCRKYSRDHGIPLLLSQTWEAETIDHFVRCSPKGRSESGENESRQLRLFAEAREISERIRTLDPGLRVTRESLFHDFHEGGATVTLNREDFPEDVHGLSGFFYRLYRDSRALGIKINVVNTRCEDCGIYSRGKQDLCPACLSGNVAYYD